jgi:D-glycero-D-manno-heptose 1,7-bisphosphate phosphatase
MFEDIAARYQIGLAGVPSIGDSQRDLEAGAKAGCVPLLVLTGKGRKTRDKGDMPTGTRVFADLAAAADALIADSFRAVS